MLPSRLFFNEMLEKLDEDSKKLQCDIYEKDGVFNIEMDIPGYEKNDISIEFDKGNLIVTAERETKEIEEDKKYICKERKFYGKYQRTIYLGDVDEEGITAKFNNGILKITVPRKVEEITKKVINID